YPSYTLTVYILLPLCPLPTPTPFPYTTLFRSPPAVPGGCSPGFGCSAARQAGLFEKSQLVGELGGGPGTARWRPGRDSAAPGRGDRKSTRLNSSHQIISYAVVCLKNKTDTGSP